MDIRSTELTCGVIVIVIIKAGLDWHAAGAVLKVLDATDACCRRDVFGFDSPLNCAGRRLGCHVVGIQPAF